MDNTSSEGMPRGIGRRLILELFGNMSLIFGLDVLASLQIEFATVFSTETARWLTGLEYTGGIVFLLVSLVAMFAELYLDERRFVRVFLVYLVVASVHVLANIAALLVTAHIRNNDYLWGVWDVGAAYMMTVAVFTGWYWVCDTLMHGNAFAFPSKEGREAVAPSLVDYFFIAFNTNSTFGPTSEAVLSRRVKILMMLQTSCSLVILLVLVARVVGLGGAS